MKTPAPVGESDHAPLPVTALAAAAVALSALGLTLGQWLLPLLLVGGLAATLLTGYRFSSSAPAVVGARILLYGWVLAWAWLRLNSEDGDSLEVLFAHGGALGAGCELMLQAWLRRPFGGARGAVTVLLSAGIMMGACVTFDADIIQYLAPAYMLLLAFSIRAFASQAPHTQRRGASALAIAAIVLAVSAGAGTHQLVMAWRYEISRLGARLFNENVQAEPVGLSTTPRLGASYGNNGSTTRVLRLRNWPLRHQYLRVMSFSTYRHGAWLPLLQGRQFHGITNAELAGSGQGHRARIDRLIDDEGLLPVPLDSVGVAAPDGASLEMAAEGSGPLRSIDPAPFPFVYEVTLPVRPNTQGPLCVPPSQTELQRCLQVPDEIPLEVRLLAHSIAGHIEDPMQRVKAIENYLMANNAYSTTTRPGEGDPAAAFILEKRAAHCEYFASAAAMLLRCVDVPARYVIGYYVNEKEGDGAVVRFRDGHAWCESWIPGHGWVTVDATPSGARPDAFNPPIPFWQKLRERTQDLVMLVRNAIANGGTAARALLVLCAVGTFALALARRLAGWRGKAESGFSYTGEAALRPVARRFEKHLRRCGVPCAEGSTWREHLDAAASGPGLPPGLDIAAALSFIRIYNRARFAADDTRDARQLHELLRSLEQTSRQGRKGQRTIP